MLCECVPLLHPLLLLPSTFGFGFSDFQIHSGPDSDRCGLCVCQRGFPSCPDPCGEPPRATHGSTRLGSAQSQPARAPSETIGHFRRPVAAARDMAEASVAGCHFTTHARAIQIAVKRSKRSGTVTRLAPMTSIALNRFRDDTLASRLYPQSKTKIRQSDASSVSHAKYEYNTDATAKVLLFKNSFIQVVS